MKSLFLGLLKKCLSTCVPGPHFLQHIKNGAFSAPFVSFGLRSRSLREFFADAIKHMCFTAQDGPDPSKNCTKRAFYASLSLAVSADVIIICFHNTEPPSRENRSRVVHIFLVAFLKVSKTRGSGDTDDRSDVLFTALLGGPSSPLGAILGPSWAVLGTSWWHLGASCTRDQPLSTLSTVRNVTA